MKTTLRKCASICLVWWDNGQAYEEHDEFPIAVLWQKADADQLCHELREWVAKKRKRAPKLPEEVGTDEWCEAIDRRRNYVKGLKPPFGIECLKNDVQEDREPILSIGVKETIGRKAGGAS